MNSVGPHWGLDWGLALVLSWWFGVIVCLLLLLSTIHDHLKCINLVYISLGWYDIGWQH